MVGLRCFELGSQWAEAQDVRTVALPSLRTLNDAALETVHLAIYDHGDAVYIEKLESPQPIVARSFVGGRCPAFCVATGRALLAHQPSAEIARVLAGPLPRFTGATSTTQGNWISFSPRSGMTALPSTTTAIAKAWAALPCRFAIIPG